MVCAVVEGVTFGLAYAMDALRRSGVPAKEVTLVGGGSASNAWAQLCADIFEMPVMRPAIVEAAASGAARQAQWAIEGSRPAAARVTADRFDPRPRPELRDAAQRMETLRAVAGTDRR
jgi:xylulokinase